ncbi:NYN domain-containing protein [bacterium]|jgi:uncharacterized LabA/DUF88 family protein|nr:NYN domain-containing protein [bacterium]
MAQRIAFLVDGFNVYHSVLACLSMGDIRRGKWFDYRKYFEWLVSVNPNFAKGSSVSSVRLYSAFAFHIRKAGVVERHRVLNSALEARGAEVTLGNFKSKTIKCGAVCGLDFIKYEEKETDINVAMGMVEAFVGEAADCAVIVSGDTDLIAAIRTAKLLFPEKRIGVLMPAYRGNNHIKSVAHFALKIKPKHYEEYQMPDQVVANDGTVIQKPASW